MNEYLQIEFHSISDEQRDILIARLAEIDFEGFEETETGLNAFISTTKYDELLLKQISLQQNVGFTKTILAETNWNEVWEANFNPVAIDDFVTIRADFHKPITDFKHEIIVTPKMSFGTGHHATTYMMIKGMKELDFKKKTVLDFGTGTGILAILAEKMGAKKIIAFDNDDWSIENASENIKKNDCSFIDLQKKETASADNQFDIILANINKNVIIDNLSLLAGQLAKGGNLLLSGLLKQDENDIFRKTDEYSLQIKQTAVRDNWLFLRFSC